MSFFEHCGPCKVHWELPIDWLTRNPSLLSFDRDESYPASCIFYLHLELQIFRVVRLFPVCSICQIFPSFFQEMLSQLTLLDLAKFHERVYAFLSSKLDPQFQQSFIIDLLPLMMRNTFCPSPTLYIFFTASATESMAASAIFFRTVRNSFSRTWPFFQAQRKASDKRELAIIYNTHSKKKYRNEV